MAQPIDRDVYNRLKEFKADELWTLVFSGNNY